MKCAQNIVATIALLHLFSSGGLAAEVTASTYTATDGEILPIISIRGELYETDAITFEELAATLPGRAVITLDSPGGSLNAGIAIGRAIRKLRYSTAVTGDGICASACALAWLGGRTLYAAENARIGFHLAYLDGEVRKESGMGNALVGLYLGELGLGENVVRYVTTADPNDMQWLSFRDAALLGLSIVNLGTTSSQASAPPTQSAPAANPDDSMPGLNPANAVRAITNAIKRYETAGISGLQVSSMECWRVVEKKRTLDSVQYCRHLDLVGQAFNSSAVETLGSRANIEYYSDENRISDLIDGLFASGF